MGTGARYDAYASWYDARLGQMTREIAVPILQAWLGTGPGVCLDLGCGGGVHLAAVAALGWSVVGLDVSWRQLRIARERSSARAPVASDAAPMPTDASRRQAEAAAVPTAADAALMPADATPPTPPAALGRAGATLPESGAAEAQAGATTPVPPRTVALVQADAARLPLADAAIDAVVVAFIHSDVDDWAGVLAEVRRVLRPGGRCVSIGIHPCFVGPFSRRTGDEPPRLHPGYRRTARTWRGPGLSPHGVWWRVGGQHVPLAALVNAFIQAGLVVEHLAEPGPEDYPRNLAIVARRPQAPRP